MATQNVDKMTIHRNMYDKKGKTMLQPFNRHILITPEFVEREKKKEQSTILLPDDYTKVEGKYCSAVVHSTRSSKRGAERRTVFTPVAVSTVHEAALGGKQRCRLKSQYSRRI